MTESNFEAPSMVMVEAVLPVDDALDGAEVLDVARDGDGAFLLEPVFIFSFFQQLHEQWVVHVHDRNHKPLLLLPLPYQDRQTPFRHVLRVLLLLVVKVEVRNVQVKAYVVMMMVVVLFWSGMMIGEDPHMEKESNEGSGKKVKEKEQEQKRRLS